MLDSKFKSRARRFGFDIVEEDYLRGKVVLKSGSNTYVLDYIDIEDTEDLDKKLMLFKLEERACEIDISTSSMNGTIPILEPKKVEKTFRQELQDEITKWID